MNLVKRRLVSTVLAIVVLFVAGAMASAHTPLFTCWDNGDGTLTCEGGFSDGSSAAGVEIRVLAKGGEDLLFSDKLDKFGSLTFDKPEGSYVVRFEGGPGHSLEVDGADIKE